MKQPRVYQLIVALTLAAAIILTEGQVKAATNNQNTVAATDSSSLTTAPQQNGSSATTSLTSSSSNPIHIYSAATKDVATAQAQINQAKQAVQQAANQLTSAETIKNNAQTKLNDLKNQQVNLIDGSQITLTSKQKNEITNDWSVLNEGPASETSFVDNQTNDKNTVVDTNNLTQAQAANLSAYAASLINNLRGQLNYSALNNQQTATSDYLNTSLIVTSGAINFAKQVAANYNSDHWNGYAKGNHDVPAIQKAAAINGLDQGGNYYEDMESFSNSFTTKMTVYAAKQYLYNAIYDMLFNDASESYAHAHSLLGLDITAAEGISAEYFAVSFDQYGNIHLELIKPDYVTDQTKFTANFDTTPLTTNQSQISIAQNALDVASKNYANALTKYNSAKQQLEDAQNALTTAQSKHNKNGQYYENGHWYLYQDNVKQTGFQYIANQHKTVYYNNNGQMLYGQQYLNGHWYLFDTVIGSMKTGFQYIADQHKTVYYNNNGQMLYGQQYLNGHWYLFDTVIGSMKTGFQYIANQHKTVYYNNNGQMLYGQQHLNGHWYLFDTVTGSMKTGFQYIANQHKTVYYNNNGQMLYGQQHLNGHWYLFDTVTGSMKTGFQYIANQHKTVYYNNNGQMLYGFQKIKGKTYHFNTQTGARI
ncbi:MAG: SEC10/PgrA surface exclusion domain-containing protein [Liquorilactobacillus nagelii]|uniref:N-acetylmuramoyl-L-alanine amidase family protein n=1 Tax=Liquorilactobacillus nagelii TaxID=82688 RepID=UPI002431A96C|nr:SEC10/PgrA surface exclusion domain-containing protein [Liquorilactobacillus nagelii]MCI1633529.1 SEC10/PgrA surface exclusion domain-containing protein [Liquorilactobacillus nagelii]